MQNEMGEKEDSKKCLFSFRSDDSFDLLVSGPAMQGRRPAQVPPLNFYGLPEYETSSDEGEGEQNPP